ncbi:MAG TPA: sulfatase [Longimicrobiaceae bacterium]|nr:sulfatase [Longimicrobiaceae bacterium]
MKSPFAEGGFRGIFPLLAGALLLLAAHGVAHAQDATAQGAPAAKPKYNVLFIVSDDLRPELGAYGNPIVQTPNLDRLAARGMRFDRAYAQYPLCNPSRTSFLTGRYPTTTGVMDNLVWYGKAHPDFVTLPRYFRDHGYVTLETGKIFHHDLDDTDAWTEGGEPRHITSGQRKLGGDPRARAAHSDRYVVLDGDGESNEDYVHATQAIEYLKRYRDRPFFLALGLSRPHSPPAAPKKFYDLYDPAKIPLPPDFAPTPAPPPGFPELSVRRRNADLFIGREATPREAREMIRAYYAATSFVDEQVGRVLDELDRLGLRDHTIVVFFGDHGYHLGEKGKWSKAYSLFEVGLRVPLLVAVPGVKGEVTTHPVELLDLYPTLAELCGLPRPAGLEGHSLVPLLRDPDAGWDHPAFSVTLFQGKLGRSVRTDRWHYAEWDEGRAGAMLFDETADPHEMRNLADDAADSAVVRRMKGLLKQLPPWIRADER